MATFASILTGDGGVRSITNDADATAYRNSDANLIGWANEALYEIALRRPDLFSKVGAVACVQNNTAQVIPAPGIVLLDILNVQNGNVVTKVSRQWLDQFIPSWHTDAAASALHWVPDITSPTRFFIYPKAPAAQSIVAIWAEISQVYVASDPIPITGYDHAIKDYVIFRAEAVDDESVNTARALAFYQKFDRTLGISVMVQGGTDVAKEAK